MKNDITNTTDLSGLVTPVAAPFNTENSIDETAFLRHLHFLENAGITRIMVNGTTGEFFSLTKQQRYTLLELARKNFNHCIIYHTGSVALDDNITEARFAADHGADAIATIVPYYYANAPASGIVEYFNTISDTIDLPFILYNFPMHTQNPLTGEILKKIRHFGMKDSSANLQLVPHTPHYYVGGDAYILNGIRNGAYGFVSARSNFAPELFVKLENAMKNNDPQADTIQARITELKEAITGTGSIPKIKYAISKRIKNYPPRPRPPLQLPDNSERKEMDALIAAMYP